MIREITVSEKNPYGKEIPLTFLVNYWFDTEGPVLDSVRSDEDILGYLEDPKEAERLILKIKEEARREWYESKADSLDDDDPFDVIKDTAAARREDDLMDAYYETKYGR